MSGVGGELIDFLLPKLDDPLQVGFLSIIGLMMAYTIISAHLAARPASWEKKWNRGTPGRRDDDLDIEHGSVTDLWHAVATSSEKLAEIMPGMLLVVGLLGTFLGLGMALDHASSILGQANAIADGMGDLLGLLKGLGTKFKTSTWGIMGFVLLKIWSEVTRFEEKRLTWVIDKVKAELERRKKELLATEEKRQQALFSQIGNVSLQIVEGFKAALTLVDSNQQKLLIELNNTLLNSQKDRDTQHQKISNQLDAISGLIVSETKGALDTFQQSFEQAYKNASVKQQATLDQLESANKTLHSIHTASSASSDALADFTEGTQKIVQKMADAAQGMADGSTKVSTASEKLGSVVDAFGTEFKGVLNDVRKDLSAAITKMSKDSAATLEKGSAELAGATKEISKALAVLSSDVKATMGEVKDSIDSALTIQRKSAQVFTQSADTLNAQIEATTISTKKLGDDIKSGLESVAGAGQQMKSIGRSLEKQAPMLERIANQDGLNAIPDAIQKMTDGISELISVLEQTSKAQAPNVKSR